MLKSLTTHSCYLKQLNDALSKMSPSLISEYEFEISLFRLLNFDPVFPLIELPFSSTDRPARLVIEKLRALFYAARHAYSPKELSRVLRTNPMARALCGFSSKEEIPNVSSFYDFMALMVPISEKKELRPPYPKVKKPKIGGDQKQADKRQLARTTHLAQKIMDGKISLSLTPERLMQLIFAEIAVKPSIQLGLLTHQLIVSGDGTCLETGASRYGKKVCDCKEKSNWHCSCKRLYSDPLASIGWDSHKKRYFYGYTLFFLSSYSTTYQKDLPISLRLFDAKRHDSLAAMLSLVDFKEIYPTLHLQTFLGDSAMDNGPMYSLLETWDTEAIIDLNARNSPAFEKRVDITFDNTGRPICPAHLPMSFGGSWNRNMQTRVKYRCPAKASKKVDCPLKTPCSTSDYGRTVYVHGKDDLRMFPRVPRNSKKWRKLYKQRTATERVNKQVLLDHGLENSRMRSKHRYFFYAVMSCIDIHLKAQLTIAS